MPGSPPGGDRGTRERPVVPRLDRPLLRTNQSITTLARVDVNHDRRRTLATAPGFALDADGAAETVALVKAALPRLQAAIPSGIKLTIVSDRTETIRASVRDVQITLIMSMVLVIAVIFLFLGSMRNSKL